MALTFDIPERDAITLPECIDLITQIEDIHDKSQPNIEKMAAILKRLSNNKNFLVDLLERDLKDFVSMNQFQKDSPFPQQVISLGGGPGFWLRANIWPVTHKFQPQLWERNLFAYLKPHDHNAGFLTVGYWGPGYETDIHEYDPEGVIGYAGERVALRFLERTCLDEGKVMYYRANRDIHTQISPDASSISINLLIQRPGSGATSRQFWFDLERNTIDAPILLSNLTSTMFLSKLAGCVGSDSNIPVLKEVLTKHCNAYVRAAAFEALCQVDVPNKDHYISIAGADKHPVVRRSAAI